MLHVNLYLFISLSLSLSLSLALCHHTLQYVSFLLFPLSFSLSIRKRRSSEDSKNGSKSRTKAIKRCGNDDKDVLVTEAAEYEHTGLVGASVCLSVCLSVCMFV